MSCVRNQDVMRTKYDGGQSTQHAFFGKKHITAWLRGHHKMEGSWWSKVHKGLNPFYDESPRMPISLCNQHMR